MASGIRTLQRNAINKMLDLNRDGASDDSKNWNDPWKILVYDAFGRDIISPLLLVADLRKRGITLHLLLDSEREQIADVPAIYFVQPTAANVKRLGQDCARALYHSYYVNFTPAVPRPLLEELATATLESESVSQVSKVVDQYLNFASLEEDLFTLMQPRAYATLQGAADAAVEAAVDAIVGALFSVLVTMGVVPILRYPRGGPAQAVAERLKERLHDQLKSHSGGRLFSESHSSGYQRPLLVLFDRAADLGTMVQHCWSYCALCHDVLGMRLNRLTIDEKGEGGAGAATKKTYDLQPSDAFWADHMEEPFQTVASDVDMELNACAARNSRRAIRRAILRNSLTPSPPQVPGEDGSDQRGVEGGGVDGGHDKGAGVDDLSAARAAAEEGRDRRAHEHRDVPARADQEPLARLVL